VNLFYIKLILTQTLIIILIISQARSFGGQSGRTSISKPSPYRSNG